ncbi:thiamine phosphate synthase [Halococcoides cellulosivorans]|uniref:Thiamine-phosphate synthase n=1 Tax=Halococcoides cellulosivorans TaxID=1679096 RepID=A0A2R4X0H9_9EURY|nr:thiamine phosphate synthase [Halococcoides cellulosivorans]AWB27286.1 thiamine phosphate synthase [Halococcoides cellulosivorans]
MFDPGVYLVTQRTASAGRPTDAVVVDALDGGLGAVQLREKGRSARERYHLGRRLRALTDEYAVPLLVNDRVDLALAIDADGVHLGASDLPLPAARDLLGADAILGRSVSTVADAREAAAKGADYLGVGAVYPTTSKDDVDPDEQGIGTDRVAAIDDAVDVPIVAIGGITAERAPEVLAAGADTVAVVSAITAAEDPERATRRLADAVDTE